MASLQYGFASVFLRSSVIRSLLDNGSHTQFAAISKCLSTVLAFVSLVASMASFMAVQGCLPGKGLAADRATKVFIWCDVLVGT